LNYTAATLGHIVAMWAQGDGIDTVTNGARRVTDATELVYPGIAPATLTAFPSPIPGDKTVTVTVCVVDALASPLQGVPVAYQMNLSGGTGSIDGNGIAGTLDNLTGPNGCVDATVVTSGVPASTSDGGIAGSIDFSAAGQTATVNIVVQLAFLSASPTVVCPGSNVSITALTTDGSPAANVPITATCTTGFTPNPASSVTGPNGSAVFQIGAPDATANGTCTFSTGDGGLSVTVTVGFPGGPSPPCGGGGD
jgi:hypothetical protein